MLPGASDSHADYVIRHGAPPKIDAVTRPHIAAPSAWPKVLDLRLERVAGAVTDAA
jgi:hypothetical protein